MVPGKAIIRKAGWIADSLLWFAAGRLMARSQQKYPVDRLTIGITTYKDRFENCFKPLLAKICLLFPDCQIIVGVNGHFRKDEQIDYIRRIEKFCSGFQNVELKTYTDPVGLSFLWNTIIKRSSFGRVIILNDDLKVRPGFRKFISGSGILEQPIAVINSSWSHFLISRETIGKIGWFDEHLTEIGGEDDDYAARLAMEKVKIQYYKTPSIGSKSRRNLNQGKLNSYGKDMSKERGGYSTVNTEYLESKWIMSDTDSEGAVLVPNRSPRFWKPRDKAGLTVSE